jgi:hypothetical protein
VGNEQDRREHYGDGYYREDRYYRERPAVVEERVYEERPVYRERRVYRYDDGGDPRYDYRR